MLIPETEIVVTKDGVEMGRTVVRPGDYIIGRDDAADIVIEDELIAPRHAQLTINYHELYIEDLGSVNGTFVAGKPVSGCTRVWPHQKMQLGSVVLETRRLKASHDVDQSLAPETATLRRMLPDELLRERKYEIGGVVAQGGMGAILGAHEVTIDRKVAMKVMLSSGSESDLLRFLGEAKITGKLEHPNIVPVHELGVDEHEQVYYTMKFVEGTTLKKVLELLREGLPGVEKKFPLTTLLTVLQKICDAIAFAHSKGVIHRDLKPENIMLGPYGEVLVMDWGLAKLRSDPGGHASSREDASSSEATCISAGDGEANPAQNAGEGSIGGLQASVTIVGTVLGTPHYMSPEQARGDIESLDERTDIYALGAILYQILALRPPVAGERKAEILENVRFGRVDPLLPARPGLRRRDNDKHSAPLHHLPGGRIPASLAAVAMKALAFDPSERYRTVQDLQAEITRFQSGFATSAEGAGLFKQLGLLVARHQREAAILAASIVALLVLGFAAFNHISHERNVATRERARAEVERERAQGALADLRKSAPAYYGQARALVDEQKFDEAIEKIDFALQLAPENAEYHLFRAHTHEAMQRLPEAMQSYRRTLLLRSGDVAAKTNLALCERLLRENGGVLPLTPERQGQLLDALVAQKRSADSVLLARALGRDADLAIALIRIRLKGVMNEEKWNDSRLGRLVDGTFSLDLSNLFVPELSILRDLPISVLQIANCGATDLAPLSTLPLRELTADGLKMVDLSSLKGLRLQKLSVRNTPVATLVALAGMPLRELVISQTAVTDLAPLQGILLRSFIGDGAPIRDLSPLRGMPLEQLSLRSAKVEEIDALSGMPLKSVQLGNNPLRNIKALGKAPVMQLDLGGCAELRDLSPLAECKQLRTLLIPAQVDDVRFTRALPSLQRLSSAGFDDFNCQWAKVTPAAEFFERQGNRLARLAVIKPHVDTLCAELRKFGLEDAEIERRVKIDRATGLVDVDLNKLPITDLSVLKGVPVRSLRISETNVVDLSPLRGMPLVKLTAGGGEPISDLSPLAGCSSLRSLWLSNAKLQDLRPLAGLKLDELHIGTTKVTDLTPLRGMPLRQLSVDYSPVADALPLLTCVSLEDLTIGRNVPNLSALRRLPKLTYISEDRIKQTARAARTAAQFWAQFDAAAPEREMDAKIQNAVVKLRPIRGWNESRLEKKGDGTYRLDLSKLPVTDLGGLRDLAISDLDISNTRVAKLAPIAKCPLQVLIAHHTTIEDLAPLRGMALEKLDLGNTNVADLRPLKGMPLRWLSLRMAQVSDIGVLEGMPLEFLNISVLDGVSDLRPLQGAPLTELLMERTSVADLKPMAGCTTLKKINLCNTKIVDLRPLTGRKLTECYVVSTKVRDLQPLRGMPLRKFHADFTDITDLSPIFECDTLEELLLPPKAKGLAPLRLLPNMRIISFHRDAGGFKPAQTPEEFWAEVDETTKK